jgi:hypothetical protein
VVLVTETCIHCNFSNDVYRTVGWVNVGTRAKSSWLHVVFDEKKNMGHRRKKYFGQLTFIAKIGSLGVKIVLSQYGLYG